MGVELIPARLGHLLALARQVDPGRLALMRKIHADPRRAIASMFDQSRSVLALRVDGHVIAAYGLVGALLGDGVMIWVLASPAVARHAMAFMRACRDEYRRLAVAEERVTALIIASDDVAIRFARWWGFRIAEEVTNGAHLGVLEFQRPTVTPGEANRQKSQQFQPTIGKQTYHWETGREATAHWGFRIAEEVAYHREIGRESSY